MQARYSRGRERLNRISHFLIAAARLIALPIFVFGFSSLQSAEAGGEIRIEGREVVQETALPVVRQRVLLEAADPFFVTYATVDLRSYRVGIAVPNETTLGGASLERLFLDSKAIAIINASFLDSFTPALPSGLLLHKRKLLNDFKPNDPVLSALVCFRVAKNTVVEILGADSIGELESRRNILSKYTDCAQVGPLLFLNGKSGADLSAVDENVLSPKHAERSVERSFIGKTGQKLVIGVTSPTSLYSVRQFGTASESKGGLGLESLVGLSSRSTSGLLVAGTWEKLVGGNVRTLVPSAIIVSN
jgi:hypothetical protein